MNANQFIWDPAMFVGSNGNGAARTLTQVRTGHGEFNPNADTESQAVLRNSYASKHGGGGVFALCDGSTHFISDDIDHNNLTAAQLDSGGVRGTYQQLFSRSDGTVLGDF